MGAYDADFPKWDVSSVTDMIRIFAWTTAFDTSVSKWDGSSVTTHSYVRWRDGV